MFSCLKGVKPQQLILHAAMRQQNQEHSPRGTTFTCLHKNDLFILSTLLLSVSSRVLEAVTTPRLVLISVPCIIFLLVLIAVVQTPLVSPENQSLVRYTVH